MSINLNLNGQSGQKKKKYIRSIRELSLSKNLGFIEKLLRKGYIVVDGSWDTTWTDNYIEQLTAITNHLEAGFGMNWDIHIMLTDCKNPEYSISDRREAEEEGDSYDIRKYLENEHGERIQKFELMPIVYYKNQTLRNENEKETLLEDFIVGIPLSKNPDFEEFNFRTEYLYGGRYHYSLAHYKNDFVHSHLHKKDMSSSSGRTAFEEMGKVGQFCLGGGSETADLLTEIRANGFDEGLYGLLITMIDTIVTWESIAGTPYNYLSDVVESTERQVSLSRSDLRALYNYLKRYLKNEYIFNEFQEGNIKLNYVFNQGRYRVKQDSDLERTIRFFVENYQQGTWLSTLLVKEKDKKFYGYSHGIDNDRQTYLDKVISAKNELPYTIIGGRKVQMNIRNSRTKAPDKNDYFIYPKFKQYVAEQFENELYEKAVTSSAIARQNQASYA